MAENADPIEPTIAVRMPPSESRPAPTDYKSLFDEEVAIATATSLRGYLVGLSNEDGCTVSVSGEGREIECRSNCDTSLRIEAFGEDVFDMNYSPNVDQILAEDGKAVLMLLLPGYDADYMVTYARHFLKEGRIEI
jgi:hypothetical protein